VERSQGDGSKNEFVLYRPYRGNLSCSIRSDGKVVHLHSCIWTLALIFNSWSSDLQDAVVSNAATRWDLSSCRVICHLNFEDRTSVLSWHWLFFNDCAVHLLNVTVSARQPVGLSSINGRHGIGPRIVACKQQGWLTLISTSCSNAEVSQCTVTTCFGFFNGFFTLLEMPREGEMSAAGRGSKLERYWDFFTACVRCRKRTEPVPRLAGHPEQNLQDFSLVI
jgi:hypothetical protein